MLKIRSEQMDALEEYAERQFERKASDHVRRYFSTRCSAMSDEAILATVRQGVERARSYGIELEYDVLRFINHMCALGLEFDTDARFPWVQEVLGNDAMDASSRMDELSERTSRLLQEGIPQAPVEG
jgi:hypothetical protein